MSEPPPEPLQRTAKDDHEHRRKQEPGRVVLLVGIGHQQRLDHQPETHGGGIRIDERSSFHRIHAHTSMPRTIGTIRIVAAATWRSRPWRNAECALLSVW